MSGIDHVAHDAFARQSLHRETSDKPCAWCGQTAIDRPNYTYTVESDDSNGCRMTPRSTPAFCNLDCLRSHFIA
jgi:hypothetical protein